MPEKMRPPFAIVEMEPMIRGGLRDPASTIRTAMGKHNRIEIGHISCLEEKESLEGSILTAEDLEEFNAESHSFYRLTLTLTLLPDEGCRFKNADFVIDFSNTVGPFPLILSLKPSESISQKLIVKKKNNVFKTTLPIKVLSTELGTTRATIEEIEQIMVGMESFGVRTKQSGWRFKLTDSREIPLSTTDLEALIVMHRSTRATAEIRLEATIDILSAVDKWLTLGFKRKGGADLTYDIPCIEDT